MWNVRVQKSVPKKEKKTAIEYESCGLDSFEKDMELKGYFKNKILPHPWDRTLGYICLVIILSVACLMDVWCLVDRMMEYGI